MIKYVNGQQVEEDPEWYEDEECPECGGRWKDCALAPGGKVSLQCDEDHRWSKEPPAAVRKAWEIESAAYDQAATAYVNDKEAQAERGRVVDEEILNALLEKDQ